MASLIGQSLGRYHILERLGEGGMAIVYKAYDMRLETDVAVKIIRTENILPDVLERSLKRFEREAKSLARLTHPNIVKVTDYGEFENKPYLVMPYLPGGTLKDRIKQGPLPWQDAVRLLVPIAQALEYAHNQNIIHRDVKPSNIMLTDSVQPMLTDFGVAKLFDMDVTSDLTGTGMGVGTPEYMAPEQWQGQISVQTDVYALGVVLYEMVTGRKPYIADTPVAVLLKQATEPLPRPRSFVSSLPDAIEKILLKALAKKPENRYQNMGEFMFVLERLIAGRTPRSNGMQTRSEQTIMEIFGTSRYAMIFIIGALIVFFLGVIIIGGNMLMQRLSPEIPIIQPMIEVTNQGTASPTNLPPTVTITDMPTNTVTPINTSMPTETETIPPTPTAVLGLGSTMISEKDGMTLIFVPAGDFTMGSEDGGDAEKPIHTVYLADYYIDQTEVTNAMYAKCVDAGRCNLPSDTDHFNSSSYTNHPITFVNWDQANTYCSWAERRLPTEAEWEKSARGPSTGSGDARTYPWGNEAPNSNLLNYNRNVNATTEVGRYPDGASPYGAYDMAGNAWEWVNDWYSTTYYQSSPPSNPMGPDHSQYRVMRGGSWYYSGKFARSAYRNWGAPEGTFYGVSFRCVSSLP